MADFKQDSDALSKLIQLQAGRHDIRLVWAGKGTEDLVQLCSAHAVQARLAKHLYNGFAELVRMPEMKTLPESMQAQIMGVVLSKQALVDLDTEAHAHRMASTNKPKGSA